MSTYKETIDEIKTFLNEKGYDNLDTRVVGDVVEIKPTGTPDSYFVGVSQKVINELAQFHSIDVANELGLSILSIWEIADDSDNLSTEEFNEKYNVN